MADESVVRLDIPSDPKVLGMSRHFVKCSAELAGFEERDARLIMLAVDEACTNVIRHSYRGDVTQRVLVTCRWVHGEMLEVRLRDFGQGVNPALLKEHKKRDKSRPGGLGLAIIRQVMDSVEYDPECDDGVELRMLKHVRAPEEQ